jgi:hypothetical protein
MSSITEAEPSGLQSTTSHRHVIPLRRKRPIAVPNFDSDSDSGSDALSLASNAHSKADHASGIVERSREGSTLCGRAFDIASNGAAR